MSDDTELSMQRLFARWILVLSILLGTLPASAAPPSANFRHLSWTQAFDAMHRKLSHEYPFTEWKGIRWSELRARYRDRVVEAERRHDSKAYYLALREYAFSLPDGHVALSGDDEGTMHEAVGGSSGLGLAELDDHRIIITEVVRGGPAAKAGVPRGAELLQWQGRPVLEALAAVSTLWADGPMATNAGRRHEQLRFLPRAPVGTSITLTYREPGKTEVQTATFVTVDDGYEDLFVADTGPSIDSRHTVRARILPDNIGYVRLEAEEELAVDDRGWTDPIDTEWPVYHAFERELKELQRAHVRGVILDLRGNCGGDDEVGERIAGFFQSEPVFWERSAIRERKSGRLVSRGHAVKYSHPQTVHFDGPVVVLVDGSTVSNGEGVAQALQRSGRAIIVGSEGTFGAFGEAGGEIELPEGLILSYPYRASLNAQGRIQIESDASGEGGIQPDVRVPRTYDSVMRAAHGDDVELEAGIQVLQEAADRQSRHG